MTTKSDLAAAEDSPHMEPAPPPSYTDSRATSWQGPSAAGPSSTLLESSPRPPLDPEQYPLYSTSIPINAEDPAYTERLVLGIEKRVASQGEVVSHDPYLGDPAFLEAFIKQQAAIPPTLKIVCYGHHNHQSHILEPSQNRDDPVNQNRSQNDIVVDFNFEIDLTSILDTTIDQRTLLTARPDRAVPRGTFSSTFHPDFKPYGPHYRDRSWFDFLRKPQANAIDTFDQKSRATKPGVKPVKREKQVWIKYITERFAKGLPSWAPLPEEIEQEIQVIRDHETSMSEASYKKGMHRRNTGRNAAYEQLGEAEDGYPAPKGSDLEHATLLDWCREFCESSQPLKEFRFQKVVYGWEPNSLLVAIRAAIASADYQGSVQVTSSQQRSLVTVYPDNQLSRWLAKGWVVFLLWVTLLYPFVWFYKRYFAGGKWTVANAYYPLKCYVPYDSAKRPSDPTSVIGNRELRLGPYSEFDQESEPQLFELRGYKEGRFMKRWESRIKDAVVRRAGANGRPESLGDALLAERQDAEGRAAAMALDGYESG